MFGSSRLGTVAIDVQGTNTQASQISLKLRQVQVGKGGLPPLEIHYFQGRADVDLERGQATLPNLQYFYLTYSIEDAG